MRNSRVMFVVAAGVRGRLNVYGVHAVHAEPRIRAVYEFGEATRRGYAQVQQMRERLATGLDNGIFPPFYVNIASPHARFFP